MIACSTYDSAVIYHKDFYSGTNPLLKFSGYYTDTLGPKANPNSAAAQHTSIKPVYFYSNGSVFSCDNYTADYSLSNPSSLEGSWGNYLIKGDTIILEKFQKIENNYVRIIQKGMISADKIHWYTRKFHREDYKPVDYSVFFTKLDKKPDSTQNFTRTLQIYNK
jgi:hypothetical protein